MEAARKVSPAAKTVVTPFSFKKWESFAMDVVFPEPLIPKKRITYGSDLDFISFIRSGGSMRTESIESFNDLIIVDSMSCFFIEIPTRSLDRDSLILSTTSKATLFSRRVTSRSSKNSSNCS